MAETENEKSDSKIDKAKAYSKEKIENTFYGEPGSIFWVIHKSVEGVKFLIEMINEKLRIDRSSKISDDTIIQTESIDQSR